MDTSPHRIPTGFARTEQGAQSAASNYAVALRGEGMFDSATRQVVLETIMAPHSVQEFRDTLDAAYSESFLARLGLDADGRAPDGFTFVSRTIPIGTQLTGYDGSTAVAEVWCSSLLGLAGEGSMTPVTVSWFTVTFELTWADGDWNAVTHTQVEGPAPVPGDLRASTSDEIAQAVEQFGGFTYAR